MRIPPTWTLLFLTALVALTSCKPQEYFCAPGEVLVQIKNIDIEPGQSTPVQIGAFWRLNGQLRTRPARLKGAVNELGLCVDPELPATGTSELRMTVIGLDGSGLMTLGTELTVALSAEDINQLKAIEQTTLSRPRLCNSQGFCWENPKPQGVNLVSVATHDQESVWAVGAAGTIIHWNGGFWNRLDVPYSGLFHSVWVDESDDAWVAGGTEAGVGVEASAKIYVCKNIKPDLHGRECQEIPTGTNELFTQIAGVDSNHVFAIGKAGVFACNRRGCSLIKGGSFSSLHIENKDSILVVGSGGTLLRCTGGICTPLVTNTTQSLSFVTVDPSGAIHAVGDAGSYVVCKDDRCDSRNTGTTQQLEQVVVLSSGRSIIRGNPNIIVFCDGTGCGPVTVPAPTASARPGYRAKASRLTGLYVSSDRGYWLSGYDTLLADTAAKPESLAGFILRCDDKTCTRTAEVKPTNSLAMITGSDPENIWSVGGNGLLMRCAESSGCSERSTGPTWTLESATGSADVLWASGQEGAVLRCEADVGCKQMGPVPSGSKQWGIAGATTDRVWTTGEGGSVATCTSSGCFALTTPNQHLYQAIWPGGPASVWIGGGGATILRCNSGTCTTLQQGVGTDVMSIWSADGENIWAAGRVNDGGKEFGAMWRCSSLGCNRVATSPNMPSNFKAVRGGIGDRVWAVGEAGSVARCDGAGCNALATPLSDSLTSIFVLDSEHALISGTSGKLLSCSGTSCQSQASGTTKDLRSIGGLSADLFWITGDQGTMIQCVSQQCDQMQALTDAHIKPVVVSDKQHAWIVAGGGAVFRYYPDRVRRDSFAK